MVDHSVDDGHGHVVVMEELAPAGEVLVGGQDDRAVLVQVVDQLEQVVAGLPCHWQVAQFVDDQHVVLAQLIQTLLQLALRPVPERFGTALCSQPGQPCGQSQWPDGSCPRPVVR